MELSREARLVAGVTLLSVPTIMYGGVTLLGILTRGMAGMAPRSGIVARPLLHQPSSSTTTWLAGVSTHPGATALTRTPWTARSTASERASIATAPLLTL